MKQAPRARKPREGLVAAVATVLVFAACSGGAAAGPGASDTDTAAPPSPQRGATPLAIETIRENLPRDFAIQAYRGSEVLGGERIEVSQVLAAGRPVVLNFFAGLCPPCRAEMPHLQEVHRELGARFVLIGVDLGPFTGLGTNDDAVALVEELGLTFPTGAASDARVLSSYRVLGMPSTVFLTPDGKVHRKWDGPLSRAKMQELVEQLLAASES